MAVNIVDDIMGSGKTSFAIQMMNEAPKHQKFIYITPYLDEVKRIQTPVSTRIFKDPQAIKGLKLEGLKRLIQNEENIVSTHALFGRCDLEVLELLRKSDYTLILDEVMDIIEPVKVVKKDMETLSEQGFITLNENGLVTWIEDPEYPGKFKDIKDYAINSKLYFVNEKLFMRAFNVDLFKAFSEAYILTYMFNGQIQKAYFDLYGLEYVYKSVDKVGEQYHLVDYVKRSRTHLKPLINVYEGKRNIIGDNPFSLSVTKQKRFRKGTGDTKEVQGCVYNYFNNVVRGKSIDNMWTCLKDSKSHLSGNGYSKGFISHSCRATNEYSHKKNLAYVFNKFVDAKIEQFFLKNNVRIDEELYATSELVQWIWRSAIRNNQPINLYLPSSRMRELLYKWLNDEI